jgi:soluble lytic murein transglycosylase-like protein
MELGLRCDRSSTVQFAVEERADAPGAAAAPAVPLVWRGAGLVLVPDKGVRLTGMLMIEAHGGRAGDGARDDPALQRLIEQVARSYQQDSRLLNAIIHVESRFNPLAVSAKGAIGLMQVMPATAERMGLRDPERTLFDPLSNLHAGARYLRLLLDMFHGQLELAIAAYNAGEGAVLKYGGIPPYPETRAYVREVMRAAGFVNRE